LGLQTYNKVAESFECTAKSTTKDAIGSASAPGKRSESHRGLDGIRSVQLRALLAIGGAQLDSGTLRQGVHAVVTTPGRSCVTVAVDFGAIRFASVILE
jgi:hypothetical protein